MSRPNMVLGNKDCILILPSGHPASSYCLRAIQHLCLRAIQHVHNAFGPSNHTAFGPSLHSYGLRAIQHAAAGVIREVAIRQRLHSMLVDTECSRQLHSMLVDSYGTSFYLVNVVIRPVVMRSSVSGCLVTFDSIRLSAGFFKSEKTV